VRSYCLRLNFAVGAFLASDSRLVYATLTSNPVEPDRPSTSFMYHGPPASKPRRALTARATCEHHADMVEIQLEQRFSAPP